jgi:hypothetical protein
LLPLVLPLLSLLVAIWTANTVALSAATSTCVTPALRHYCCLPCRRRCCCCFLCCLQLTHSLQHPQHLTSSLKCQPLASPQSHACQQGMHQQLALH